MKVENNLNNKQKYKMSKILETKKEITHEISVKDCELVANETSTLSMDEVVNKNERPENPCTVKKAGNEIGYRLIGIAVNRAVNSLPNNVADKIRENAANDFLTQRQVRLIKKEAANKLGEMFESFGELNNEELDEYILELAIESLSREEGLTIIDTFSISGSLNEYQNSLLSNRIEDICKEITCN